MVFFATTLYKDSLTRKYLIDKNYIDEDELKDDISSKISFSFRVDKMYSESISREIEEEANATEFNPYLKLLRKTKYHEVLEGMTIITSCVLMLFHIITTVTFFISFMVIKSSYKVPMDHITISGAPAVGMACGSL